MLSGIAPAAGGEEQNTEQKEEARNEAGEVEQDAVENTDRQAEVDPPPPPVDPTPLPGFDIANAVGDGEGFDPSKPTNAKQILEDPSTVADGGGTLEHLLQDMLGSARLESDFDQSFDDGISTFKPVDRDNGPTTNRLFNALGGGLTNSIDLTENPSGLPSSINSDGSANFPESGVKYGLNRTFLSIEKATKEFTTEETGLFLSSGGPFIGACIGPCNNPNDPVFRPNLFGVTDTNQGEVFGNPSLFDNSRAAGSLFDVGFARVDEEPGFDTPATIARRPDNFLALDIRPARIENGIPVFIEGRNERFFFAAGDVDGVAAQVNENGLNRPFSVDRFFLAPGLSGLDGNGQPISLNNSRHTENTIRAFARANTAVGMLVSDLRDTGVLVVNPAGDWLATPSNVMHADFGISQGTAGDPRTQRSTISVTIGRLEYQFTENIIDNVIAVSHDDVTGAANQDEATVLKLDVLELFVNKGDIVSAGDVPFDVEKTVADVADY